jgi:hypothetical protein
LFHAQEKISVIHSSREAQIETLCHFCTGQKIFPQAALLRHCVGSESIKNERIGAQADSLHHADKWCWSIERRGRTASSSDNWMIQ